MEGKVPNQRQYMGAKNDEVQSTADCEVPVSSNYVEHIF